MDSRTSLEIISTVTDLLKVFTLAELVYVLEQDAKLSRFDIHRLQKITDAVRYRFNSNHSFGEINMAVQLLGNEFKQTLPVENKNSLSHIFNCQLHDPIILPFSCVCYICKRSLSEIETKERSVKIYCINGAVVSGRKCIYFVSVLFYMILFFFNS